MGSIWRQGGIRGSPPRRVFPHGPIGAAVPPRRRRQAGSAPPTLPPRARLTWQQARCCRLCCAYAHGDRQHRDQGTLHRGPRLLHPRTLHPLLPGLPVAAASLPASARLTRRDQIRAILWRIADGLDRWSRQPRGLATREGRDCAEGATQRVATSLAGVCSAPRAFRLLRCTAIGHGGPNVRAGGALAACKHQPWHLPVREKQKDHI